MKIILKIIKKVINIKLQIYKTQYKNLFIRKKFLINNLNINFQK